MKAIALVVSARKRGNCCDFAEFILERLQAEGVETELINFYDFQVEPCHCCSYECLQRFDPQKGANAECPITDDVHAIWRKVWAAEILLLFVPTYGGLPPALWVAFTQRMQGISVRPSVEDLGEKLVGAVVLASPHWSETAERTPSIIADEIRKMGREVVAFEVINNAGFETENLFGKLINEDEIRRRLEYLAKWILGRARSSGEK